MAKYATGMYTRSEKTMIEVAMFVCMNFTTADTIAQRFYRWVPAGMSIVLETTRRKTKKSM